MEEDIKLIKQAFDELFERHCELEARVETLIELLEVRDVITCEELDSFGLLCM